MKITRFIPSTKSARGISIITSSGGGSPIGLLLALTYPSVGVETSGIEKITRFVYSNHISRFVDNVVNALRSNLLNKATKRSN